MSTCDQITQYLPGFAGGELRPETMRAVGEHVSSCESCTAEVEVQRRVVMALATVGSREVEPPAFLLESILESVGEHPARRMVPMLPLPVADMAHALGEHRELIASAAGTAIVAAGAAYALWRALRSPRTGGEPATS